MSEEATLDEFASDEFDSDTSNEGLMTSLDETSVGNIPSEWSAVRLSELTKDTLYGANESAEDYDPDKPRYIRIKDIDEQGRLKESEKASLSTDKAEGYLLEKGDMLFARSGSPGRTYLHRYDEGKYCYGGYSIKHELVSNGLNHEYLSQYTKSQKYWNWIERIARTGAQANINSGEFASLLVPLPPVPEQRKIATVLYTVDRTIEKTEEVISQIESVLSGVTEELLIKGYGEKELQQNRIYSFDFQMPTDWEVVELQSLNKNSKPICYGIVQPGDYHEDGIPILNIEHSRYGDEIDTDELHRVSTQLHEKYSRSKLTGDEIVISVKGSTGDVGKVPSNIDEWNISRDLARISPNDEINRDWLRFYLSTKLAQKFIHVNSPGSTRDSLNIGDLKQLPILLPPQDEQDQIADVVADIEDKLDSENQYLNQLRRLKRGLMQDLLSGTVRTTDSNIEVPEEVAQYG